MITKVTITGADDSTDLAELAALSHEFPHVEWGILVSRKMEGGHRFPSRDWISRFSALAIRQKLNVSMHVCGFWVREMFVGRLNWSELPDCLVCCQRVQINTHAEQHVSTTGLVDSLMEQEEKQFIFQWDGVNNHLAFAALAYNLKAAALFDTSGGAGMLPTDWPDAPNKLPCGYAGGLSDENVVEQIGKIEKVCAQPYWIDMERRVRTADDSALVMSKVRRVLELTKPFVGEAVEVFSRPECPFNYCSAAEICKPLGHCQNR